MKGELWSILRVSTSPDDLKEMIICGSLDICLDPMFFVNTMSPGYNGEKSCLVPLGALDLARCP